MAEWSLSRSRQPELMDDPALPAADHLEALAALATINAISGTANRLVTGVRDVLADRRPAGPLRVVDVACGGGDVTLALARRLRRAWPGTEVVVTGIDLSPRAIDRARALAASRAIGDVAFEVCDVLREGCPPCDVTVNSLFLHHLDDPEARDLLAALARRAAAGVVVSDLVRSRTGLVLARLGTQVLSGSRVARIDGPLSVRAARTPAEYERLFAAAGLTPVSIRRVWPERVICSWSRSAPIDGAAA